MDFKSRETDINIKLAKWAACGCCARHNRDKPTVWAGWKELPLNGTRTVAERCVRRCDCRHNARILCRMHEDSDKGWLQMPETVAKARSLLSEEKKYVYPDPRELEAQISRAPAAKWAK